MKNLEFEIFHEDTARKLKEEVRAFLERNPNITIERSNQTEVPCDIGTFQKITLSIFYRLND